MAIPLDILLIVLFTAIITSFGYLQAHFSFPKEAGQSVRLTSIIQALIKNKTKLIKLKYGKAAITTMIISVILIIYILELKTSGQLPGGFIPIN